MTKKMSPSGSGSYQIEAVIGGKYLFDFTINVKAIRLARI